MSDAEFLAKTSFGNGLMKAANVVMAHVLACADPFGLVAVELSSLAHELEELAFKEWRARDSKP